MRTCDSFGSDHGEAAVFDPAVDKFLDEVIGMEVAIRSKLVTLPHPQYSLSSVHSPWMLLPLKNTIRGYMNPFH
ncbi:hypothetical protein [Paenibacillus sp. 453mf]|uniref:hypothetical protein n=1 Tax=Paenibacillus sp. 453mf TaxID=1761874 RepID=UPI001113A5B6|nr:hypothetical protein [Paenibacillus sp. 453mf]